MCGIALAFSKNELERKINSMTSMIYHRGPDDKGVWISNDFSLALGHRRLSILDLSPKAHQPMSFSSDSYVIVFNGEIYNFKEIRLELEKAGYSFFSNSDTEVILASYHAWGKDCVHRSNGMWAFAIFDKKDQKVFCSRDRVGIKPLYYYSDGLNFYMASEIKSILAAGVKAEINNNGLCEYFTFQNIISNSTLFKNIYMLKAGYNLELCLRTGQHKTYQYWDMKYNPVATDEDALAEELYSIFYSSMKRHMISDVEIGATISGGMDSSAIIAIASTYFGKMHTFTGHFNTVGIDAEDRSFSELDDARIISNLFETNHHERLIVPQDVIDTLPQIIWHLEDPKVGMCYTFFTISQLVSSKVKVSLSGTGGDEIFAGYPWRYNLVDNINENSKFDDIYYKWWSRLVADSDKKYFFKKDFMRDVDIEQPRAAYMDIISPASDFTPINRALYFDMKTFLHGFLMVEDKMGMAYSIETRFPFLDKELLDFMQKVPDSLKMKNGTSKYILKKAFGSLLPDDIIYKRKQGFTPPDRTWYKRELKDYINTMLLSPKTMINEYIDPKFIRKTIERHNSGADERLLIWSLLFFEGWCRIFIMDDGIPHSRLF